MLKIEKTHQLRIVPQPHLSRYWIIHFRNCWSQKIRKRKFQMLGLLSNLKYTTEFWKILSKNSTSTHDKLRINWRYGHLSIATIEYLLKAMSAVIIATQWVYQYIILNCSALRFSRSVFFTWSWCSNPNIYSYLAPPYLIGIYFNHI